MKRMINILRATIVGGVLFLAPFVVFIIIFDKALKVTRKILTPIAEKLPIESLIGLETPKILAIGVLVIVCILAGLFAKTSLARKMVGWIEDVILSNLPGYSFIKTMGEEIAGTAPAENYESVLVRFDDAWQIGFLVERITGDQIAVYIPGAPSPWTGGVFIFNEDRITPLQTTSTSAVNCLRKLGAGIENLLSNSKL